jgi:uncharacterized repeat protein (TIGR01451 family)
MRLFTKGKRSVRKSVLAGVIAGLFLSVGLFGGIHAGAAEVSFNAPKDCDNNAVIRCGTMKASAVAAAYDKEASVRAIYDYFGIDKAEVQAMKSTAVAGKVMKNGDIVVNGKVVATNALTAGRQNISGSKKVAHNGATFYTRAPEVSFNQSSLDAYVVMVGGKFSFAVIASCGNPVKATPKTTPKPNYTLTKEVQTKGGSGWQKNVTVKPGTTVTYRVTVKNTGDTPIKPVGVKDKMPAHATFVPGTLKDSAGKLNAGLEKSFFGSGMEVTEIARGGSYVLTFDAVIGKSDTSEKCTNETLTNLVQVHYIGNGLPKKDDKATVSKQCNAKPVYACVGLTSTGLSRTKYQFTLSGNAQNGATITGYKFVFDSKNPATTTKNITSSAPAVTTEWTYDKEDTYNVVGYVSVKVDNNIKTVTADKCKTNVTVKPAPVAECTDLDVTKGDNRKVSVELNYAPANATIKTVSYDFGDNTTPLVTDKATAEHTYTADGSYTIKANVTFTVETNPIQSECQEKVEFTPPTTPQPPVTTVSSTTPTSLPSTGPADALGIVVATAIGAAIAHRLVWARFSR